MCVVIGVSSILQQEERGFEKTDPEMFQKGGELGVWGQSPHLGPDTQACIQNLLKQKG